MSSLHVSASMLISCLILGTLIGKFWPMETYFGGESCMKKGHLLMSAGHFQSERLSFTGVHAAFPFPFPNVRS